MKNGFTLIELLAVIVILAIIALIATPIVLSVIENAKESAIIRGADYYVDAIELSITGKELDEKSDKDGVYYIQSNGNLCLGNDCNELELEVEVSGEIPSSGTVTITNGQISQLSFTYANKEVVKDGSGHLVFSEKNNTGSNTVCRAATAQEKGAGYIATGSFNPGDAYICEVKDKVEYLFYVLSTNNAANEVIEGDTTDKTVASVNLIMNGNIYYDSESGTSSLATVTTEDVVVNWNESDNNSTGPVTAMTYLHNATKDWNNIPNMIMNYTDEGQGIGAIAWENGEPIEYGEVGYGRITTTNGVTTITKTDGIVTLTIEEPLKARMPMKKEVPDYLPDLGNQYLYDYLPVNCTVSPDDFTEVPCDEAGSIVGVYAEGMHYISPEWFEYTYWLSGYWTLSSNNNDASYTVRFGEVYGTPVYFGHLIGVRPVITVPTSMLSQ